MSAQDNDTTAGEEQRAETRDGPNTGEEQHKQSDGGVDLSEEGQKKVDEMVEAYEDKPTAVLPGTHGTITGTAINEWLDEEGNPKFGDPEEHPLADEGDESEDSDSSETPEDRPENAPHE